MKKREKILVILMALVLCVQSISFAASTEINQETGIGVYSSNFEVKPFGVYLDSGKCIITPGTGCVEVSGYTEAFTSVSQASITLTVYRQTSSGSWTEVWSDTYTDYNTYLAEYDSTTVYVPSGYNYKIKGTHTVKNNGITETNYSESNPVYVY